MKKQTMHSFLVYDDGIMNKKKSLKIIRISEEYTKSLSELVSHQPIHNSASDGLLRLSSILEK